MEGVILSIKDILSDDIRLRTDAYIIENIIKNNPKIRILDYVGVKHVSRAFAAAIYEITLKYQISEQKGMNKNVEDMFTAVVNTYFNNRRPEERIPISRLKSREEVQDFFNTID